MTTLPSGRRNAHALCNGGRGYCEVKALLAEVIEKHVAPSASAAAARCVHAAPGMPYAYDVWFTDEAPSSETLRWCEVDELRDR